MTSRPVSFSLDDEPWIEAIDRAGRSQVVSLRELLATSHDLRAIGGEAPTMAFAMLRLVLAVLHAAIDGPADTRTWRALWRDPALPVGDVNAYLDRYRDQFDLLHPTMPFYQVADLHTATGEVTGLERIIADVPNGTPYLTSRLGPALTRITAPEAARWLVHCQAFDTSGIKSGAVGDPRVRNGRGYPRPKGLCGTGLCGGLGGVFLEGQTLRETLLLNLVPYDTPYLDDQPDDRPTWERPPHGSASDGNPPRGRLSLYTWQSRRIRLFGNADGITGALVAYGDDLGWDNRLRLEPMTGWRRNAAREKETKQPQVYTPAGHRPERALWRGLGALLPVGQTTSGTDRLPPVLAQWLARLRIDGHIDSTFRVTAHAVGIAYGTQQSVVDQIYDDTLVLPVQAFGGELRVTIVDSAADAEATAKALGDLGRDLCRAAGGSGSDRKDAPAAAADRARELALSAIEQRFRDWIARLTFDSDPVEARVQWQRTVHALASALGNDLIRSAGPAAWAGRTPTQDKFVCSSLADLWFRRALNRVLPLARQTDPAEEQTDLQEVPV